MSLEKKIARRKSRRAYRIRKKVKASNGVRLSVFKSLNHIYGQIIDDSKSVTLASYSSLEMGNLAGDKKKIAKSVGLELARRALENGVKKVSFDRGPFLYHGRVKAFADGLREGGLIV